MKENVVRLVTLGKIPDYNDIERYRELISKCNNTEFREILEIRLNNYLKE